VIKIRQSIYYWRESKYLTYTPTEVPKEDYKKIPISLKMNLSLDDVFQLLNNGNNPLNTRKNQEWISEHLRPDPHTSMSIGDIIQRDNELFICCGTGWQKVKWCIENHQTPSEPIIQAQPSNPPIYFMAENRQIARKFTLLKSIMHRFLNSKCVTSEEKNTLGWILQYNLKNTNPTLKQDYEKALRYYNYAKEVRNERLGKKPNPRIFGRTEMQYSRC
jgi:hypothetical protein